MSTDQHPNEGITQLSMASLMKLEAYTRLARVRHGDKSKALRSGMHQSRFRGRGMEFEDCRPYLPGDDTRHIDWKVSARTQQTHTKLFSEEKERPLNILVDLGPSMDFGTVNCTKAISASRIACFFAWNSALNHDRLSAVITHTEQNCFITPAKGRRNVVNFISQLSQTTQRQKYPHRDSHPQLQHAVHFYLSHVRPGSINIIISDFLHFDEALKRQLQHRLARHSCVLVQVCDPLEQHLPDLGIFTARNGDSEQRIDSSSKQIRKHWQQQHSLFNSHFQEFARELRAVNLSISTALDERALITQLAGVIQGLGHRHG